MAYTLCKVDMHVHSQHSKLPSSWILKRIGCSESYTDPLDLYHNLKNRGMDLVTITDHNTIEGCLEVAHLNDTFISEEVTAYFPEDDCRVHVLVYNISEKQHKDLLSIRENIYELVRYLREQSIFHALAHPMYSVDGRLKLEHFQKLLLLFTHFELNGARDSLQNTVVRQIVNFLNKEELERLADWYKIKPVYLDFGKKHLISGSDDHSSLYMGYSYTEVPEAECVQSFFAGLRNNRQSISTHNSGPKTLAHNIYSIIYQFYDHNFDFSSWLDRSRLGVFLRESLLPCNSSNRQSKETDFVSAATLSSYFEKGTFPKALLDVSQELLASGFQEAVYPNKHKPKPERDSDNWLEFMHKVSARFMDKLGVEITAKLNNFDLLTLFPTLGSLTSMYMLLAPYFISYSLFARDRAFSLKCLKRHGQSWSDLKKHLPHPALFTDTFQEKNGVATVLHSQLKAARLTDKPLTLIHCDSKPKEDYNIVSFKPIGQFDLPEYPELKVFYPPLLSILSYCYEKRFTHIQAETPGTMGLTALVTARMLNLPFHGTYHTSLPQTVKALTGSSQLEALFWQYIIWFYGQMERIYVPSQATAHELIGKGFSKERIHILQAGVNTDKFHPSKRNGYFATHYHLSDSITKLLYVGRISREKNLEILEKSMHKLCAQRRDICLIVVGEGPYLSEMRKNLKDLPVIFTGYLTGEELAQAYASADIFLFPSIQETLGYVVMEAQASGLPAIVSDLGGPRENIIDQETGFVISSGAKMQEDFAQAVFRLCDNPGLMTKMGENARKHAQRHSIQDSFLAFWDTYSQNSSY